MYYKIENRESVVYKELFALRKKEQEIEVSNRKRIEEKIGLEFSSFFGVLGQQNYSRVTTYGGFVFSEVNKVDLNIWKKHKNLENVFIPNTRLKAGREMKNFLSNELEISFYTKPLEILKIEDTFTKFSLPFVEIVNELIIIRLDDQMIPKDKEVVEITSVEFNEIYKLFK